jgi:hypothetical protein
MIVAFAWCHVLADLGGPGLALSGRGSESAKDAKAALCCKFAELQLASERCAALVPTRTQLARKRAINILDIIPPWLLRKIACSACTWNPNQLYQIRVFQTYIMYHRASVLLRLQVVYT